LVGSSALVGTLVLYGVRVVVRRARTTFWPKEGYVRTCTFSRNLSKSSSPFAKASTSDFFARMVSTMGEEKPVSSP